MNNASLYLPIVDPSISLVRVQFLDPNWDPEDENCTRRRYLRKTAVALEVGNYVVAQARNAWALAQVHEINVPLDLTISENVRWIVQRVDFETLREVLDRESTVEKEINRRRVDHARAQMLDALGIDSDFMKQLNQEVVE